MEVLFGDGFQRSELINARVVDQDVQPPERVSGVGKQPFDVGLSSDICLHGDSLAAGLGDFFNDLTRSSFTGGIIDNYRRPFGCESLGDGGANSFGCPGDECDFADKFFV